MRRALIVMMLMLLSVPLCRAQEERDSLIRLVSADRARLVEIDGREYRRVTGNAVFFHNNTYLRCDSAYWNVDDEYIDAIGHVRIEQENTVLTGDSLKYVIPANTASFRGHVVELVDADGNLLRTNYLDYNTKDSIAVFYHGGAMKDTTGNIIESLNGKYESRIKTFEFVNKVEMFTDSIFFICDRLLYDTRRNVADFYGHTKGWYDENHLSSSSGWYDRANENFFFTGDVHILTRDYEVWCDSLFYDRMLDDSRLYGDVMLLDTVDKAIVLAGKLLYWSEPRRAELYREPALVMMEDNDDGGVDSTFMAADTIIYYTQRMFEVDSVVAALAKTRREEALVDPLAKNEPAPQDSSSFSGRPAADSLSAPPVTDSLSLSADSLSVTDSTVLEPKPDTTGVDFVEAYHHVRIFRDDMQVTCDSLLFTSLDSIARLFKEPVIWYETTSQITADSMQFLIRDKSLDKGFLFSNAFVISEEEENRYYHQIKSPEMVGYFENGQISRFDAMGGVTAIFYVSEDSVITTMNQKECRIMTGRLKDGQVQRILYMENIKSDAYPVWYLTPEMMTLRDFEWIPELRPATRHAVTPRYIYPSERKQCAPAPDFPAFVVSGRYFGGYMDGILSEIERRKPLIWIE
ncbi:MAG TPA: hypothetical protein IAC03_00810 [Candidatus Coprenecus pullistercoris]|nr:hypothetical protein [Candidatus Coprenecus pullistercoris]